MEKKNLRHGIMCDLSTPLYYPVAIAATNGVAEYPITPTFVVGIQATLPIAFACVVFRPQDRAYYAGSNNGRIYRSYNGTTWTLIASPTTVSISGIAVNNTGRLVIAFKQPSQTRAAIAYSDNGTTWTTITTGLPTGVTTDGTVRLYWCNDIFILCCGVNTGVARSLTSDATSWSVVTTITDPAFHAWGSAAGYFVATTTLNRMFKSTTGSSFTVFEPANYVMNAPHAAAVNPAGVVLVFGSGNTKARSLDGGNTWQPSNGGIATDVICVNQDRNLLGWSALHGEFCMKSNTGGTLAMTVDGSARSRQILIAAMKTDLPATMFMR